MLILIYIIITKVGFFGACGNVGQGFVIGSLVVRTGTCWCGCNPARDFWFLVLNLGVCEGQKGPSRCVADVFVVSVVGLGKWTLVRVCANSLLKFVLKPEVPIEIRSRT